MTFVLKVSNGSTLRRVTLEKVPGTVGGLTFGDLEAKIRELFQLGPTATLVVTYTDNDNDVVTMGSDEDLRDACSLQSINPLRLTVVAAQPPATDEPKGTSVPPKLRDVLMSLPSKRSEPAEKAKASAQIPELVENIVRMVTAQIQTAVKGVETSVQSAVKGVEKTVSSAVKGVETIASSRRSARNAVIGFPTITTTTASNDAAGEVEIAVTKVPHFGVTCDGCQVSPIVGPRFKSSKKLNYDLCQRCFVKYDGENSGEYYRIDRPLLRPCFQPGGMGRMTRACSALESGYKCHGVRPFIHRWRGPHGIPQVVGKLDARFVRDVSIFDGTELAPGTHFTKTWRLRNSGTVPWPVLTKLVHVDGDEMGSVFMASVEVPEQGLAPEEQIDVSVDLIAPEQPGRYASHWRLASPCGDKFGHRIWVLVQVVPQGTLDLPVGAEKPITPVFLNHDESGLSTMLPLLPRELTVNYSRSFEQGDCTSRTDNSNTSVKVGLENPLIEPVEAIRYPHLNREQSVSEKVIYPKIQVDDTIFVDGKINYPKINSEEQGARQGYPLVNSLIGLGSELGEVFTMVDVNHLTKDDEVQAASAPAEEEDIISTHSISSSSVTEVKQEMSDCMASEAPKSEGVEADSLTLQGCLAKLEAMGFTNRKLNEELLLKNGSDLRKTLDDLCAAEEWDPILEELEEMGFFDTEMNRRLMFKNNGSVKRVVKELVEMYRDMAGNERRKAY